MSPLSLRRYRAERLLRERFDGVRERVLDIVGAKLRARGVSLAHSDLEGCYAQAWQGLYGKIIAGEAIANPDGWLVTVTFRRAIDEHRSAGLPAEELDQDRQGQERDLVEDLEDRAKVRMLLEGMRGALSRRELEAASLCYLQGLTRAEAAERMGIGGRRMQRLMEGGSSGSPGVAAKLGEIAQAISSGRFCEEHDSLMRAFAFGALDSAGERYEIARLHLEGCSACRAHVRALRGLSAVLPPVFLPGLLGGILGSGAGAGAGGVGAGADGASASGRAASRGGGRIAGVGRRVAGTGTRLVLRSGGRMAIGAKLAATGLAVLGAGAGAIALTSGSAGAGTRAAGTDTHGSGVVRVAPGVGSSSGHVAVSRPRRRRVRRQSRRRRSRGALQSGAAPVTASQGMPPPALREFGIERRAPQGKPAAPVRSEAPASSKAQREFGIE